MRRVTIQERRSRLVRRHLLAPDERAETPEQVASALVALHSSDPSTVFLAARARLRQSEVASIERALYEDRSLIRMHGMRRTLFVVPRATAPLVQACAARAIAVQERRRVAGMIESAGIATDAHTWLRDAETSALQALRARGEASAAQLGSDEPRLREQMTFSIGKRYENRVSVSTRLLFLLAMEGHIVRGRPLGTWISSQYRWLPVEAVFPGGFPDHPVAAARTEIIRQWLSRFGPGTMADIRWWTGWTVRDVSHAVASLDAVEVDLDGSVGLLLPDDLAEVPAGEPSATFLPALDPTVMGWTDRRFFLGEHGPALFDTNGNAGPTVWWDGRIIGGWGQRGGGEVVYRLLEDVGADATAAIDAEAERLGAWVGGLRVTPRFRTPLDRELST